MTAGDDATPQSATAVVGINAVELPVWIVSLARTLARTLAGPGDYTVRITIPRLPAEPVKWILSRDESLRRGEA